MIVASIDIGTNTALLLVADSDGQTLEEIIRARRVVRLGEGVDSTGFISRNALARLERALEEFKAIIDPYAPTHVIITGTSASRDAANKKELLHTVLRASGHELRIISGENEALLTFSASVDSNDSLCTVVDIGGGSTELVHGRKQQGGVTIDSVQSYDMGSVRLTERHVSHQPIDALSIRKIVTDVRTALEGSPKYPDGTRLIGAGGTATTSALLCRAIPSKEVTYDNLVLSFKDVDRLSQRLNAMTFDEISELDPELMKGRADVLPAGVMILLEVMRHYSFDEITVSFRGVRHGVAMMAGAVGENGTIDLSPGVLDP